MASPEQRLVAKLRLSEGVESVDVLYILSKLETAELQLLVHGAVSVLATRAGETEKPVLQTLGSGKKLVSKTDQLPVDAVFDD